MKPFNLEKRTLLFSADVIRLCMLFPRSDAGIVISKQLIRAATSIGANIAEGQGGASQKDFRNYYVIARKSSYETIHWLHLSQQLFPELPIQPALQECSELRTILTTIILNLQEKQG